MVKNRAILLDSCIVSNLLSIQQQLAKQTFDYLAKLTDNNSLYLSEYSYYELLKGADTSKIQKVKQQLTQFTIVPQNQKRLERAALLYTAYAKDNSITNLHSISNIDILIGLLIFTEHKSLLLTADYNDFPRPYFNELHIEQVNYQDKKKHPKAQYYYLFEGNTDHIFK